MIVSHTLSPTAAQSAAQTSTLTASGNANNDSSFVAALVSASAAQPGSGTYTANNAHRSFRSGQLSIDMHADGQRINGVSYFDEAGQKLTTSGFWPQDILRNCEKFNIPLSDLQGLGPQLDVAGVRYKPYEQYAGTGSNHGIDLDDLASGGMGTAYDWTQDALVHLKGPSARAQLQADQALAQRLGLRPLSIGVNNAGLTVSAASSPSAPTVTASSLVKSEHTSDRTLAFVPTATSSSAEQATSALDKLLQLISQVKTNMETAEPKVLLANTSDSMAPPAVSKTIDNTSQMAVPTVTGHDPASDPRLFQMRQLLDQLFSQR